MLALSPELQDLFAQGGTLLVPSRQRAAAVRLAFATASLAAGLKTWRTPQVLTPQAWLQQHLDAARQAGASVPRVLRPLEEWVLWQRAAARLSAEHAPLLNPDALASALREAAQLACDHGISITQLGHMARHDSEPAWLLAAMTEVQQRATQLGAIPAHHALANAAAVTEAVLLRIAGLDPLPKAWQTLLDRVGARALEIPAADPGVAGEVSAEHTNQELQLAAQWSRDHLRADGRRRLLIVIPDLQARRAAIMRIFRDTLCADATPGGEAQDLAFVIEGGEPLANYPWITQALNGLSLLVRPMPVEQVLEWLRSPFWVSPSAASRARFDLAIRERVYGDYGFNDLLRGLSAKPLGEDSVTEAFVATLRRAAAELEAPRLAPREWAERFARSLELLGCNAAVTDSAIAQQLRMRWQELLEEFGEAGRTAGTLSGTDALALLATVARQARFAPATGDAAVTITASRDHPVVRYAGIWVCGCTASQWPGAADPDAFVPRLLQRVAGVAHASAAGQLEAARRELLGWCSSTSDLRLSWSRHVDDAEASPSALLEGIPSLPAVAIDDDGLTSLRRASALAQPFDDDVAPRWDAQLALPRGSRSLELQDVCAFRAFAELRLGAQALESAAPGADYRERGKLIHLSLQKFWELTGDHASLVALMADDLRARIAQCVAAAGRALAGGTADTTLAAGRDREREEARARRQLERVCAFESQRDAFRVAAIERRHETAIGAARLRLRIDRIDELAQRAWALIDYKTSNAGGNAWLNKRPRPVQLLVYLAALRAGASTAGGADEVPGLPIAALATLHLGRQAPRFRGVSDAPGRLPGVTLTPGSSRWKVAPNAATDWPHQLQRWHERVQTLAADFLAGRAIPDPQDREACRNCGLTALCRRVERVRYETPEELDDSTGDYAAAEAPPAEAS